MKKRSEGREVNKLIIDKSREEKKQIDDEKKEQYFTIETYTDADWAGDIEDRKSTTGYLILLNGNLITWTSSKQKTVSFSSMESETIAMSEALKEMQWVKNVMEEMKLKIKLPMIIHCDNRAAIIFTGAETMHKRSKHFDIRYHYIKMVVSERMVEVRWVESVNQLADILTKPLPPQQFNKLRDQLLKEKIAGKIPTQITSNEMEKRLVNEKKRKEHQRIDE